MNAIVAACGTCPWQYTGSDRDSVENAARQHERNHGHIIVVAGTDNQSLLELDGNRGNLTRQRLAQLHGTRADFTATFREIAEARGRSRKRVALIQNIKRQDTGEWITDHMWLPALKWTKDLRPGDRIAFSARVGIYRRGYMGNKLEDRLERGRESLDFELQKLKDVRKTPYA